MLEILDQYEIKVGIEEELFVANPKGFLAGFAENVAKNMIMILNENDNIKHKAEKYLHGLQWEPNPAQIEYVTKPLHLDDVKDAIKFARDLLVRAALKGNLKIIAQSVHPIQSNPLPINGMHINISLIKKGKKKMTIKLMKYVYNHIRNHIPELIAISANSPVISGQYSGYASSRLRYSRVIYPSDYAKIKTIPIVFVPQEKRMISRYIVIFDKKKSKRKKLIANPQGIRLLEITPRGPVTNVWEDIWRKHSENRVEIRVFDIQALVDRAIDLIYILVGLSLEALILMQRGKEITERKNLNVDRLNAIKYGTSTIFYNGNRKISARDSIKEMIGRISEYLDYIGIKMKTKVQNGISELDELGYPRILDENQELFEKIKNKKFVVNFLNNGKLKTGLLLMQYNLKYKEDNGLIIHFDEIHRSYLIMSSDDYYEFKECKILSFDTPLSHIIKLLNSYRKKV